MAERGAAFFARYFPKEAVAGFRADKQIIDPVDQYMEDVIIHGSPTKLIDELRRLEAEMPLDYLLLSPLSETSFDLFTERVLPELID